jgi:flavin reductase (DIM6/NTAB) family NADH-FMN oxidoreductase RutF
MDNAGAAEIFRRLDRELWLVTAAAGDRRGGLIATFVSQASIVPGLPRVLLGLARQHQTWELVERSRAFGLHLLDERHLEWVWRFGLGSGRDGDKLEGLAARPGLSGSPLLDDAPSWLDCSVETSLDIGDRTVYVAEVLDARAGPPRRPLTVARMLELAPEDRRGQLAEQMRRDALVDAVAIETWRRSRQASG